MLDWLAAPGRAEYEGYAGENKLQEAPATPGPVFAYRAFRDALLGTPAAEPEQEEELTVPIKSLNSTNPQANNDKPPRKDDGKENVIDRPEELFPNTDSHAQSAGSPTKSILLTPGTGVARRKTVSFGEGVVDNEQKRPALKTTSPKKQAPQGSISRQWTANLASGTQRNRSKFTQALLDAREKKPEKTVDDDDLFDIGDKKGASQPKDKLVKHTQPANPVHEKGISDGQDDVADDTQNDDVTTNLDDPRSQSGKYWKSEFESYRAKTNQEIKKLIQYRSVAKSYAKKKETEAVRLAEKLKREEERVDEMERHVSKLAADMTNGQDSSKEDMIKELSKQTALVLQYKQKTESLRRTMERHGVFEDGVEKAENDSDDVAEKLRETEKALEQANAKLKAAGRIPDRDEMQHLVETSEAKAKELERENSALKRNLARAKEEMSKYEERRKAKEDRLKQREQKLESRLEEYTKLLKEATKRREDAEEEMKATFDTEKKQLQETIASLKEKLQYTDRGVHEGHGSSEGSKRSARTNAGWGRRSFEEYHSGIKERRKSYDSPSLLDEADDDNFIAKTEPDGYVRAGRHSGPKHSTAKAIPDDVSEIDFEEPLITFDGSTPRKSRTRANVHRDEDGYIPPSSPPLPDLESSIAISPNVPKHLTRGTVAVPSPRPSRKYMGGGIEPRRISDPTCWPTPLSATADQDGCLPQRTTPWRVAPTKSSRHNQQSSLAKNADAVPNSDSARSEAEAKLEAMPPDRLNAAKARLKQKQESNRNTNTDEKENYGN